MLTYARTAEQKIQSSCETLIMMLNLLNQRKTKAKGKTLKDFKAKKGQ
jgi:hypothetical protein